MGATQGNQSRKTFPAATKSRKHENNCASLIAVVLCMPPPGSVKIASQSRSV
jgi:hypothetical protein